jgi:hypothetical protein
MLKKSPSFFNEIIDTHPSKVLKNPFPHVHVESFFKPKFYKDCCDFFNEILDRGVSDKYDPYKFSRYHFEYYNAFFWQMHANSSYPISQFLSIEWVNYFSNLFNVELTNEVSFELRHHKVDTIKNITKYVHNDFYVVGFPFDVPDKKELFQYYFQCPYLLQSPEDEEMVNKRMRSVVAFIYINNQDWEEKSGGVTALYKSTNLERHVKEIPPISNSMLAFEITPYSYHSYINNNTVDRNTIMLWFHSTIESKSSKFPGQNNRDFVGYTASLE